MMPVTILTITNMIALIHLPNKTITERMFITFFGLYRNRMLDTSIAIGKSVAVQPVARRKRYKKVIYLQYNGFQQYLGSVNGFAELLKRLFSSGSGRCCKMSSVISPLSCDKMNRKSIFYGNLAVTFAVKTLIVF